MLAIIWFHAKACAADLRARNASPESLEVRPGGQLWVIGKYRQWRVR